MPHLKPLALSTRICVHTFIHTCTYAYRRVCAQPAVSPCLLWEKPVYMCANAYVHKYICTHTCSSRTTHKYVHVCPASYFAEAQNKIKNKNKLKNSTVQGDTLREARGIGKRVFCIYCSVCWCVCVCVCVSIKEFIVSIVASKNALGSMRNSVCWCVCVCVFVSVKEFIVSIVAFKNALGSAARPFKNKQIKRVY
jgi:hypothetical protein